MPFVSKFWVSTGDDYSKHRVLNDRFYLKWNEWRLADYEVRRLISDLNNGRISEDEFKAEEERMRADGTLELWNRVRQSGLDKGYDELRKMIRDGYDDEDVRKELLELKRAFVTMWE